MGNEVPCRRYSVIHGDYHSSNVILKTDGSPAVLDWSMAAVGDARYDLAWSLLLSGGLDSEEKHDWMLQSYWDKMGEEPQDIRFYEGLASAFRLSIAALCFNAGCESIGLIPEALERIKESRGHYERVYLLYRGSTGRSEAVFEDTISRMY
jgi:aminoglycoside/choline kinase family phosphotransferase